MATQVLQGMEYFRSRRTLHKEHLYQISMRLVKMCLIDVTKVLQHFTTENSFIGELVF